MVNQRTAQPVAPQEGAVGTFAHHVEFIEDGFLVLGNDCFRAQAAAFRVQCFHQTRNGSQDLDVFADRNFDAGSQHFDHNIKTCSARFFGLEFGGMHLGNRGRCQRLI